MSTCYQFLFDVKKAAVILWEIWTYSVSYIGKHCIGELWLSVRCLALHRGEGVSFTIPDLTVAKAIPFTEGVLNFPVCCSMQKQACWDSAALKDFMLECAWGHAVLGHTVLQHQAMAAWWSRFLSVTPSECWLESSCCVMLSTHCLPWVLILSTAVLLWHQHRVQRHVHDRIKIFSNCFGFSLSVFLLGGFSQLFLTP